MSENPNPSDPWLDARLRNVPLPVGLLRRLEQLADPEVLRMDRSLVDVPLPEGMLDRLRDISRLERQDSPWRRVWARPRAAWAVAASLLLALGAGYWTLRNFGAPSATLADPDRVATGPASDPKPFAGDDSNSRSWDSPELVDAEMAEGEMAIASDLENMAMENGGTGENPPLDVDLPAEDEPRFGAEALADDLRDSPLKMRLVPEPNLDSRQNPPLASAPKNTTKADSGHRGADDPLGSGDGFSELPDLDEVAIPASRGMTPPIVAEYDLLFQLKYGQHPIISPGANPVLRTVQTPLVTSSAPWRRIASLVAEGRLPSPGDVRTEDFLAALDYHFPPAPEAGLAIETAAGPAPLAAEGLSLLQVAVHAGEVKKAPRQATHLTLVVDGSLAMRRSDRWNVLGEVLDRLVEQMQPRDRLTVIAFSEESQTVIDAESPEELLREGSGRLTRAIEAVEGRPAANLAAGVQWASRWISRAAEAAQARPANVSAPANAADPANAVDLANAAAPARRMVIISGGRVDSGEHFAEQVQSRLTELVDAGLVVQVVDMAPDNRPTGSLDAWARAGRSRLGRAADPRVLAWRLLEGLLGHEPVVAQQVTLRVTFEPEVVASYRLLGHEREYHWARDRRD